MKISKIKLLDGGLKGLKVDFVKEELKDGQTWLNKYPGIEYRYPVQGKLLEYIQSLTKHLGKICDFAPTADDKYQTLTITGVTAKSEGFIISGKAESTLLKTFAVNTPFVTEDDDYEEFDKVNKIIEKIFTATEKYVEGEIIIDKEKFIMTAHKNDDNFDSDAFAQMSEDEKFELYKKELENMGHIVIVNEEERVAA